MKDKVVIVTGASSGIGKATALYFAKKGSNVVLAARSEGKLKAVEEEISKEGGSCLSVPCDVSKPTDCENLISKTVEKFKKIDVLINNAGISMRAIFNETDLSVIREVMDINFFGMVNCTKYALPYILKNKGSVVGVSSIAGYVGLPARTGYSASKYAMHGFLDALRIENIEKGLHVLVACPGFTASNIRTSALTADGTAQGESPRSEAKMMQPGEVATDIYKSIVNRDQSFVLTSEGKLAVFLSKWAPKFLQRMVFREMKKEPDSPLK